MIFQKTNHECVTYKGDDGVEIIGDVEITSIPDKIGFGVINPTNLFNYVGISHHYELAEVIDVLNQLSKSDLLNLGSLMKKIRSERLSITDVEPSKLSFFLSELDRLSISPGKYGTMRVLQYFRVVNGLANIESEGLVPDGSILPDDNVISDVSRLLYRQQKFNEFLKNTNPYGIKSDRAVSIAYNWIGADLSDVSQPFRNELNDVDRFVLYMSRPQISKLFQSKYVLESEMTSQNLIARDITNALTQYVVFDPYVSAIFCWEVDSQVVNK